MTNKQDSIFLGVIRFLKIPGPLFPSQNNMKPGKVWKSLHGPDEVSSWVGLQPDLSCKGREAYGSGFGFRI